MSQRVSVSFEIDLEKLTPETVRRLALTAMAFVDKDFDPESFEVEEATPQPASTFAAVHISPPSTVDLDPAKAFGSISQQAPHVEVPPPPPNSPAPAISAVVTLDSTALPWDGRIHASSKAKNSDGTWRLKRGVDKVQVDSVTAELRKLMAIPSPGPQLVPTPPPPPPPAAAPDAAGAPDTQFMDLVSRTSAAIGRGVIDNNQVMTVLGSIGVPNLPSLGLRPDLIPQAAALIDGIIAGRTA